MAIQENQLPDDALPSGSVTSIGERISFCVFVSIHLACFAAIWTGVSARAAIIAVTLYLVRMFVVTAGYHRYFSHRTYKTSRFFQFLLGFVGTMCVQKGPLWWAGTHRHHHKFSDLPEDVHSPRQSGFYQSHVGWILGRKWNVTNMKEMREFARFPELVFLNKYHALPPLLLAVACYLVGGMSGLVVGFGWSTVALWHGTFTINSLSHVFGKRRYATSDDSKNNWALALLTLGEGWHNNHHHYQSSANQGFFWWEVDISYYGLKLLEKLGVVWEVRKPPQHVIDGTIAAAAAAASQNPSLPDAA